MNSLIFFDVKYRDKHGDIRVFTCLDIDHCSARRQAMKMVCDLADYSGTILTVLPVKVKEGWLDATAL